MKNFILLLMCLVLLAACVIGPVASPVIAKQADTEKKDGYLGSSRCRQCHEKFYQLWAPSHHGLAMQPYTESFAEAKLKPQLEDIVIGKTGYRAVIDEGPGFVVESKNGTQKKYPILHALGGKNVYYFLTELERGRLQTLPVAYDINRNKWFDTAASGVRHFPDRSDAPIHWTETPYTFNTSCYGCHVSQLVRNYDPKTDSYHTEWKEPGINCETCHGPAEEHVRLFTEADQDDVPDELKLTTVMQNRGFTAHEVNSACSTCHAKGMPISNNFVPGESIFQHSDVLTLEHHDFYPDGRDLGENYTFTSWRMSPCAKDGKLDCMYCHTSSGRYRFKTQNQNDACTSCHTEKKGQLRAHSRHSKGITACIQCHMPMTEFGRMNRSDHSMRPPMPAATMRFTSPNACNQCHADKDPKWADDHVRKWHKEDYQKPTLEIAALVDQGRKGEWKNLPDMLDYLRRKDKDEIFANSLIRLMGYHYDKRIGKVLAHLLENDPSPLIRSSAADGLEPYLSNEIIRSLAKATDDPYRLVRVRAALAISSIAEHRIPAESREPVKKASAEYIEAMSSRPDNAMSHYNLGNYYASKNQSKDAIDAYEMAMKLQKDMVMPYVNASLVYNQLGDNKTAAAHLNQAIAIDPNSAAAHQNLGLLYGEMSEYIKAIDHLKKAFRVDPSSAVAAYNLCVLLAERDLPQSIRWAQKAVKLQPENAKYAYTLAFYLYRQTRTDEVITVLQPFVDKKTTEVNIYLMLGEIYQRSGDQSAAIGVYEAAVQNEQLPQQIRSGFADRLQQLMVQ